MTIWRYRKNKLLYIITSERGSGNYKVHPYLHDVEIGVTYRSHSRFRDFKQGMRITDFQAVSYR